MLKMIKTVRAAWLVLTPCGTPAQAGATNIPATTAPLSPAETASPASTAEQASAPACTSPTAATISMTEGPYFKANSPERPTLFEEVMPGTKFILSGYVLTIDCKPVSGALLDFWQAIA